MRTSALAAAIVSLTTLAATASANDDFSALLADLSFGDAPSLSEPLAVAEEDPVVDLKPVPTGPAGFTMPGMVESKTQLEDAPLVASAAPQTEIKPEPKSVPRVALQDPIPTTTSETGEFDLDEAFALQDVQPLQPEVPAQVAGHAQYSCLGESCDANIVCRPRTKPNLPKSTFLQYFGSNPCYTNVWDGYTQHCGKNHAHLHGECDCFKSKHGCTSCDRGCDR